MPYLKKLDRNRLESIVCQVRMHRLGCAGELNYLFTEIIKKYVDDNGESYKIYNDVIGALECCQFELYRRKVGIYEDKKIRENGDVF
jgi:uncharacterized protein DUF6899